MGIRVEFHLSAAIGTGHHAGFFDVFVIERKRETLVDINLAQRLHVPPGVNILGCPAVIAHKQPVSRRKPQLRPASLAGKPVFSGVLAVGRIR